MLREQREQFEKDTLSPYAALSSQSKGRNREEKKCHIRADFQRDRDRIIHSKAFRRLKHKTQVFLSPEGDHYRTRLTHTLEVSQIARTISRALNLNEDLTEAIALGHDLGHTPFGHSGENTLNRICRGGFEHNRQSLRVVDVLEGNRGLNLTWEVRDGILNHKKSGNPATLEGKVVSISDRIAYVNHDIDDALRAGILSKDMIPIEYLAILGDTHSERISRMITDIVYNSRDMEDIIMSEMIYNTTMDLRKYMFENVYIDSIAKKEETKADHVLEQLYNFYLRNMKEIPQELLKLREEWGDERVACDYTAGMTDRFAIKTYKDLFIPLPWSGY